MKFSSQTDDSNTSYTMTQYSYKLEKETKQHITNKSTYTTTYMAFTALENANPDTEFTFV